MPANEIVGLLPGEMFVHRNVANVVVHTDLNCLSVLQYAVDVLKVQHVIVCGHYGCGGVKAALDGVKLGLIDNWLRHVQDVANTQTAALDGLEGAARVDRLCELNVIEQARHVCETTVDPGRVGARPGRARPRVDLRPEGWPAQRSRVRLVELAERAASAGAHPLPRASGQRDASRSRRHRRRR